MKTWSILLSLLLLLIVACSGCITFWYARDDQNDKRTEQSLLMPCNNDAAGASQYSLPLVGAYPATYRI